MTRRSIFKHESVVKTCHERLGKPLPDKQQVTDLWKSTRKILRFDEMVESESFVAVLGSLSGIVTSIGGMRNALGDAHGRGQSPPAVSEVIAELALNACSTLATAVIRRFNQIKGDGSVRDTTEDTAASR